MNEKLLLEIRRRGLHQYQVAGLARINERILSLILRGRIQPSIHVKRRIARELGLPVDESFSENGNGVVSARQDAGSAKT